MRDETPATARHTPGPWVWRWKSGSLHQAGTDRPYGATVLAPTYGFDEGIGVEVSAADDRLIAAAPDLASALSALVNTFHARPDMLRLCGFHEHAQIKAACDALNKAGCRLSDDQTGKTAPPAERLPDFHTINEADATEAMHRAICREDCAFRGEPSCWEIGGAWPNPECAEPGCHARALAAMEALKAVGYV